MAFLDFVCEMIEQPADFRQFYADSIRTWNDERPENAAEMLGTMAVDIRHHPSVVWTDALHRMFCRRRAEGLPAVPESDEELHLLLYCLALDLASEWRAAA